LIKRKPQRGSKEKNGGENGGEMEGEMERKMDSQS
jgi:hypothetical protein